MQSVPRVLQIFASLSADDPQARRAMQIASAFGGALRHSFVSSGEDRSALELMGRNVRAEVVADFPTVGGLPMPGRLQAIARAMVDYNLVLTHGRGGAMAALAHTSFSELHALPPLIHHEDGSDETPRDRKGLRSRWSRRVGLGKAAGLVVPTDYMEAVALVDWQQPLGRVKLIRDGTNLEPLKNGGKVRGLPRLVKRAGEGWIGYFARSAASDDDLAIVDALGDVDENWHLVIVGEGAARASLAQRATAKDLDHRVHFVPEAPRKDALGAFDILALASGREPLPMEAIDAMAAGLPVCGFENGELAESLSTGNAELIAGPGQVARFVGTLVRLTQDEVLRRSLGKANRVRAEAERGEAAMVASYRRLYTSAMKLDAI